MAWYHYLFLELGLSAATHTIKSFWDKKVKAKVDEEIDNKFKKYTKQHIEQHLTQIIRKMDFKTYIYMAWSLLGLALLHLNLSITYYYMLLVVLSLGLVYIFVSFCLSIKKVWFFINHFDKYTSRFLKNKIKETKEQSLTIKLGLWISSRQFKDFENLVISYALKYFLNWIRQRKTSVIIRICFYIIMMEFFANTLKEVFKTSVDLSDFFNLHFHIV